MSKTISEFAKGVLLELQDLEDIACEVCSLFTENNVTTCNIEEVFMALDIGILESLIHSFQVVVHSNFCCYESSVELQMC